MIFAPRNLGTHALTPEVLAADKRKCEKIGTCGIGKEAIYLNNFYLDRVYYVKYSDIKRVYKRVAMTRGGYSGKGTFGSMAYLVVEIEGGREKACKFKYEFEVDNFMKRLKEIAPNIPQLSREGERRLAEAQAEEEKRYVKNLSAKAKESISSLERAKAYLESDGSRSGELSRSARQKRIVDGIHPSYKAVAMVIFALGIAGIGFGIYAYMVKMGFAIYFVIFGFAAVFLMMSSNILPSGRNSRKSAEAAWESARNNMKSYIAGYDDDGEGFPIPSQYAHPSTLTRMIRTIREGRAATKDQAYEVMKADLKALNNTVTVSKKEYDEVVAIKPMFLVCDYQDQLN